MLQRVPGLSLVKISGPDDISLTSYSSVAVEPLPVQFKHMAGDYRLIRGNQGEATAEAGIT